VDSAVDTPPNRCRATTVAGAHCQIASDLSVDGFCLWHDPLRTTEAQAARVQGNAAGNASPKRAGNAGAIKTVTPELAPRAPETLDDAVQFASWLSHAVVVGLIDARTCREAAYALGQFRFAVEKRDLVRDLRRLQDQVDGLKKRRER